MVMAAHVRGVTCSVERLASHAVQGSSAKGRAAPVWVTCEH